MVNLRHAKPLTPIRQRLLEYLGQHPGASTADLARALGLHHGTTGHHLRVLISAGLVTRVPGARNNALAHYVGNVPGTPETRRRDALLQDPLTMALHRAIQQNPGEHLSALMPRFPHASRSQVWWRLRGLREVGLIRAQPEGNRVTYHPKEPC